MRKGGKKVGEGEKEGKYKWGREGIGKGRERKGKTWLEESFMIEKGGKGGGGWEVQKCGQIMRGFAASDCTLCT